MKVGISRTARFDLEGIRLWIARDNPDRATSFVRELRGRIDNLSIDWHLYPAVGGSDHAPIHRMNHRGYRIFYQVADSCVNVLNVHQGGRATPDFLA